MIKDLIFAKLRAARLLILRLFLTNKNCSIISDNCLAGMIYHDYKMKFNSPTINTFIHAFDYNRFLQYLIEGDSLLNIVHTPTQESPNLGVLNGDVRIDFVHYSSFEDGYKKWKERVKRINRNNMLVIMTEKSSRQELVEAFEKLPIENKIALVHRKQKNINCGYIIRGFEKCDKLGYLFDKYNSFGMNYYDQVNWIFVINKCKT